MLAIFEHTVCAQHDILRATRRQFPLGPLFSQAADFGHIKRERAWWAWSPSFPALDLPLQPLSDVKAEAVECGVRLTYMGKPIPKRVFFEDGYLPQGDCLFPWFSEEPAPFPELSLQQHVSPSAVGRFQSDGKRLPASAYEAQALLWKGNAWRVPSVREKAQLHCIPGSLLLGPAGDGHSCEAALAAALENSFHIPSLAMVLCVFLTSVAGAVRVPAPWYSLEEGRLRELTWNTVFHTKVLQSIPGLMSSHQLADYFYQRCALHGIQFNMPQSQLAYVLAASDLACLQVYWADTQLRGLQANPQGLDWAQQKAPALAAAATGNQRGSGLSSFALPPLHERGLSKDAHLLASASVESPFAQPVPLDDDAMFVCRAMSTFGPRFRSWRIQQLRELQRMAKKLVPWEKALCAHMPASVACVASNKRPAFLLACALLLRWPDETCPLRYVLGFGIIGDIENSSLFRPLVTDQSLPVGKAVLLGESALQNLQAMHSRVRPGSHDEALRDMTLQEVQLGFAEGPFSQSQIDSMFGVGGWRPLERFVHVQSCGKLRLIDSGKKPGHNKACRETETIYTASVDVIPAATQAIFEQAQRNLGSAYEHSIPWLQMVLGTEDMCHAYRQCPIQPSDRCCAVVSYWDCVQNDIRFVILNGMPFGLSSAVLAFNRTPALLTAVSRRMGGALAIYFFDDTGILDFQACQGSAQAVVRGVYGAAGAQLDPKKSQAPASCRVFLGVAVNVGIAHLDGVVSFDLKPGFRDAVAADIHKILGDKILTSGQAAKLRGKFGWASTGTFGKCGRGGQAALVQRQYFDSSDALTPHLVDALWFHLLLATVVPPRIVQIGRPPVPPVRIYSDASYEPDLHQPARVGFVVFPNLAGLQPIGMTAVLGPEVIACLVDRKQQITPCEALLSVIVPANVPHLMCNQDIVWYIDNGPGRLPELNKGF